MQLIQNKYYYDMNHMELKPSERYDLKVEIAKQASRSITMMNNSLCNGLLKIVINSTNDSSKRR